jgi:hypothetical protein
MLATIIINSTTMRYCIIITILALSFNLSGQTQSDRTTSIDSTLAKKISISGFCLCQTTLTDLQKLANDFSKIEVEEMDTPKKCYGHDSRYVNGEGYYSKQYPGLIFQKEDENSDYISKIRLTKDFKGKLPNGTYLELKDLKLKDVFVIYPEFKDKWGSRGCSDYWKFSNDTISFFVQIDKNIQPQFPINESYYLDKPVEAIDLLISCYSLSHKPINIFKEPSNEPLYYLDNIQVNKGVLSLYNPNEIAAVEVLKDSSAIKNFGEKGKNGVIYITTKEYARDKYWKYFSSKSADYTKTVPNIKDENGVCYILNDKILENNFEGDLFFIDDSSFIELKVIDKKDLKTNYSVKNKKWGIVIKTNKKK